MLRGGAVRGGSLAAGRHPWPHGGVVRTVRAICAPGGGQRCMVPAAALREEAGHRPPAAGQRDCGDLLVARAPPPVEPACTSCSTSTREDSAWGAWPWHE